ncbi:unnamed protein product [Adineta steineri]|uniref:Peptidase C14 caspase domain-containing protein n=1 Tax=Adineta steineri TaxID=433720 RepID=A0A818HI95_9BILA|nr:unnamed protein product [Adineta steineri]CAF3506743.1 unnamed protein product [Adineta steineri]
MTTSVISGPRRKLALVIGISNYDNGRNLLNAINDAKAISSALKSIGFILHEGGPKLNPTCKEIRHVLVDFVHSIQMEDMVLFYYAGHGTQWEDKNYLIPSDNFKEEIKDNIIEKVKLSGSDLKNYAINAQDLFNNINDRDPFVTMFFLDCCRTYDLRDQQLQQNGRGEQINHPQGLKPMPVKVGSLIVFACAPGTVADDGEAGETNGLFTKHLLKYIKTPNDDIRMILSDVTDGVIQESKSQQIPHVTPDTQPTAPDTSEENKDAHKIGVNSVISPQPDSLDPTNAIMERTAISISGRLGTTYNALTDKLVASQCCDPNMKNETLSEHSICTVFSGDRSTDLSDYLAKINFGDALRQRLFLRLIEPIGVSSFINYPHPVSEDIWFLYYSYTNRTEELKLTPQHKAKIMPYFESFTGATHIITKIQWGFEMLCVIQISNDESRENVVELLNSVSEQLQNRKGEINLSTEEKDKIDRITNVVLYKSKYRIDLYNVMKNLKPLLDGYKNNTSNSKLNHQWTNFQSQFNQLSKAYDRFQKHYQEIIKKLRNNIDQTQQIEQFLSDQQYSSLKFDLDTLYKSVQQFRSKMLLIERLSHNQIQFIEVLDILSKEQTSKPFYEIDCLIKSKLIKTNCDTILWYSTDQLRQQKTDEWEQIYQQLQSQKQNNTKTTSLIYVDFTELEHLLPDFIIIALPEEKLSTHIPLPLPSEISVLLLGQTGTGKSTFINAFINYLMFNTLQEAEQGEPAVAIPVSFPLAVGDHFEEITVQFGDADPNENHENEGRSVTQECRSYIIDLNQRLRLRLIDSPGFGDTRGFDQDQINMNHIFTYINQLSHLNAVCLLLKPSDSKLDIFFESCVRQLLTYLTPSGYGNIIFCFTNSRSTFYKPGNGGALLNRMLKANQFKNISFARKNTFCFDSESFRYLPARKCKVEFEDYIKKESTGSWTKSVTESIRLIEFIRTLQPYDINKKESLRKAAFDATMLARPLLETLRLMIYNQNLAQRGCAEKRLIIETNWIDNKICSHCAENYVTKIGLFNIVEYIPTKRKKREKNRNKLVASNERLSLDEVYKLIDELMLIPDIKQQVECMKTTRELLMKKTEHHVKLRSIQNEGFAKLMSCHQ